MKWGRCAVFRAKVVDVDDDASATCILGVVWWFKVVRRSITPGSGSEEEKR